MDRPFALFTSANPSIPVLILNLLSIFAEFERDLVAKLIADARATLKRQGRRVGGALPFGYDADPVTKQLVITTEETKQVRAMFEIAAEGIPPSEIAWIANDNNRRTNVPEAIFSQVRSQLVSRRTRSPGRTVPNSGC